MEEWKVAVETYEISNLGNCRKLLKTGEYITIKGSIQNSGYRYFQLQRNKKRLNYLFHHLVMEHFVGPRPEGLVIDHIDRDRLNNIVSNLRYVTQKENMFNLENTLTHIPQDTPNRKSLCVQDWAMRNREWVIEQKRLYWEKNKDRLNQARRKIPS